MPRGLSWHESPGSGLHGRAGPARATFLHARKPELARAPQINSLLLPAPVAASLCKAEARLAAKRAARAEAREIRMKELERQQKEVEERPEKDFEKGVRTVSSLSAATLASLGGTSSRRGSGDTSISVDTEASIREIKDSLAEVEEKYKKAMVSNAQLDNEKTNFMYQVDTLKDTLLELEEQLAESKRQYDEKSKDYEREKHAHTILQFQFMEVKEALKQREELLAQHGIIPNSELATNGETSGGLHNVGLSSSSKMVPDTSHIPEVPVDSTLGRANEVEMKNEILENMGKKEILQNTEHEEHTEETKEQEIVQECSERETLHADENAEAEKITEGKVASTLVLNSGLEEVAKSHSELVPRIVCSPENSDVVEFRVEGGSVGHTTEVEESDENDVNKTNNQSEETGPGVEVEEAKDAGLEVLPQKQNKEKQTDIVADEGEDSNNEIFQEALDFVNDSPMASSSHSESSDLAGDVLTKALAIDSNIEQSESKIVESDLLIRDGGIAITDVQWDENESGGTDEDSEMENVVQQQEYKLDSAVEHAETLCTKEEVSDNLIKEQKQVEMEETQSSSSNLDAFTEEEQSEQQMGANEHNGGNSLDKGTEQREVVFGILDENVVSEKSDKENTMKDAHAEDTVVDSVRHNECEIHEEKKLDVEDDSSKCSEIKSEFINDGKGLVDIAATCEKVAADCQDNATLTDKQRVEKQNESISKLDVAGSMIIEDVEEVCSRNEEDMSHKKTEEKVVEVVPDVEAADLKFEKAEFTDQKRELDSEEEHLEEYHEASDFSESSFGELKATERSENQDSELEISNHKKQETDGTAESSLHNVIKEACEKVCREKERDVEEDKKEKTYQISADGMGNENILTESKNTQQQKEAEHLQIDTSISEPPEAQCEMLEDTHRKISPEEIAEYTAEQLEKLEIAGHESQLDTQMGRKGKGKSREDCIVS